MLPRPSRLRHVIVLTVVLRGLAALLGPDHFNDDRDVYLGIAQGIADGRGYSEPGTNRPTAYRPPLYPLLLSPVSSLDLAGKAGRALLHLALAVGMVMATWLAGERLGLSIGARATACLLLVVDPLLVLYANFPMTETLCAGLGAGLLSRFTLVHRRTMDWLVTGVVCGLCVLARPTFWIALGLMTLGVLVTRGFSRRGLIAVGALLLTVAPWVVRNWLVLGEPIAMTTHGGYTLLLGNNTDFYDQVTSRSFSTVWEGPGQQAWADQTNREMDNLNLMGEVERDKWMGQQAKANIMRNPALFTKASLTRVAQFWSIVPGAESASHVPAWLLAVVAIFYAVIWMAAAVGLGQLNRCRRAVWLPVVLLPLAFTLAHAVYWSNIRMRAPVMPAVVLIAAATLDRRRNDASSEHET